MDRPPRQPPPRSLPAAAAAAALAQRAMGAARRVGWPALPRPQAPPPDVPPTPWQARVAAVAAAALVALAPPSVAASPPPSSLTALLASATGDALLGASKKADAAADALVGAAASLLPRGARDAGAAAAAAAAAEALLREVHDVVAQHYLDARGDGLDAAAWDAALESALAARPRDPPAARRAARAMLAFSLSDPYTRFLSPEEFRAMARYDVTGVGLNLGTGDDFSRRVGATAPRAPASSPAAPDAGVWVVGLVRGSPAAAAGVAQGDRVDAVDSAPVSARAAPVDVAQAIAAAGTPSGDRERELTLSVVKPGGGRVTASLRAPAARAAAPPASLSLAPAARGAPATATVRLDSFNARAASDVEAALGEAVERGAGRLVLDLRGNRGGLVAEGVAVASLFLPPGTPVAVTQGAKPDAERTLVAGGGGGGGGATPARARAAAASLPLVVLVDGRTASAAEIVAGALRDACRAPLAGGRTYGKGLIQSVYELGDSSGLVLTVGRYLTPTRVDIDRGGLSVDFGGVPGVGDADAVLAACRREKR